MSDAIDTTFDLIIIGSGPGGYTAAIRASQLGLKTAIVEREQLGGICLNWGCIPTKALLRSAELYRDIGRAQDHGFGVPGPVTIDLQRLVARSRSAASKLSGGVRYLMKKNAIRVIEGQGALGHLNADGLRSVHVSRSGQPDTTLQAPRVILATGARARQLPGIDADRLLVWTYRDALMPPALPGSLLVVGSGAIGIEFASFYRALGVNVTVVEAVDRILPAEDAEISGIARASFERQGMTFHTATQLEAIDKGAGSVTATLRGQGGALHSLTVDRVLLAVGICGNVESLGLEHTRVRVEKTHVVAGPLSQTDEPGIYAIGDLAGAPWLAHKASHEAVICVEHMAGVAGVQPLNPASIPACTYSSPQIASIGLTEAAAKALGHTVKVGRHRFSANGKAIAIGEPEGMVKTVFDATTGELLGTHMIGAEVTEMIQGLAIARQLEATETDLMHTVFPHPTLSEAIHESVFDAWGRALNQ